MELTKKHIFSLSLFFKYQINKWLAIESDNKTIPKSSQNMKMHKKRSEKPTKEKSTVRIQCLKRKTLKDLWSVSLKVTSRHLKTSQNNQTTPDKFFLSLAAQQEKKIKISKRSSAILCNWHKHIHMMMIRKMKIYYKN